MARTFAYLMDSDNHDQLTDKGIFEDVSTTIGNALKKVNDENSGRTGLAESAFKISLDQLI